MTGRVVTRTVEVGARPGEIFDLLADPRRHPELDGSDTVRRLTSGPARLSLGARFAMGMRIGVPYRISNQVVEFEEGRRIAWRHFGRHVWRWELEPAGDGSHTRVSESFDYRTALSPRALERLGMAQRNVAGIEATLAGLQRRFPI